MKNLLNEINELYDIVQKTRNIAIEQGDKDYYDGKLIAYKEIINILQIYEQNYWNNVGVDG